MLKTLVKAWGAGVALHWRNLRAVRSNTPNEAASTVIVTSMFHRTNLHFFYKSGDL